MEIGIISGLVIGFIALYLDFKNEKMKRSEQITNLSNSVGNFIRRNQILEELLTNKQVQAYEDILNADVVTALLNTRGAAQQSEYFATLRASGYPEEEWEHAYACYSKIILNISQIKG